VDECDENIYLQNGLKSQSLSNKQKDLSFVNNNFNEWALSKSNEFGDVARRNRRHSLYEGIFKEHTDLDLVILNLTEVFKRENCADSQMVDQEDIIALTKHVRSFSDSLNVLRSTFVDSSPGKLFIEQEFLFRTASILKFLR